MAKQISELGASAAVAGADLFWLEQSGLPTKLSFTALQTALGSLPSGTTTDATLRWNGSAWVENTAFKAGTSNITVESVAPQLYLIETGVTADNTRWSWTVDSETLTGRMWNDANSTQAAWVSVARTLNVADNVNFFSAVQILTPPNTASASGEIRIVARGDAFLNLIADNVSDAETNNPYIRFAQDGAAVISYIGSVGAADIGPSGETFTGMVNNGLAIHQQYAGQIGLGIAGNCSVLINDSDQLVAQFPSTGTNIKMYHNGTDGYISAVNGDLQLLAAGNQIRADSQVVVSGLTGSQGAIETAQSGTGVKIGSYACLSRLYSSAYTALANNAYSDPGDAVSGQMRTAVTHGTYGHAIYEQGSGQHWWYSNNNSVTAGAVVSKVQRMHLSTGGDLTLATGGYYLAGGTKGIDSVTGQYGSVQSAGTTGGYGGYSLGGSFVLMNSGSAHWGLYNDVNNEWQIIMYPNARVGLYYNGVEEVRTSDSNAADRGSGMQSLDYGGTFRNVGFIDMEEVAFTANTIVAADHWHKCLVHTNATTHTLTFNTLTTVQNGSVLWVKARTGIVTMVDGTMVLTLYAGAALTTGNISVAIGGWATVHKTGDSAADVTGVGLS